MTRSLLFVFLGFIIAMFLLVFRLSSLGTPHTPLTRLSIAQTQIYVKVAKTSLQLQKGLGGVLSLPENQGMLFVMNSFAYHPFWMKDMKFPLDFIFIAGNKIVDTTQNVPVSTETNPPTIRPNKLCNLVLEVNAGFVKRHHVKIGQKVIISSY